MNNIYDFCRDMDKYFKVGLTGANAYLDVTLSVCGKFVVDLMKLDDLMHERHGAYEDEQELSLAELIEKEYGIEAKKWIEEQI